LVEAVLSVSPIKKSLSLNPKCSLPEEVREWIQEEQAN